MLKKICLSAIEIYQSSGLFRARCRYWPTCSHYAHDAIERHGLRRGASLAVLRLLRCHPLGSSGFDPVPEN